MAIECVKNNKGTFLIILEERDDESFLCVFPDGTKRVLGFDQLDFDSYSEFADEDKRITSEQVKILKEYQGEEASAYDYDHLRRAA